MLLADRPVLGLVAAGLPEEPDGRPLDRQPAAGAQEDGRRLDALPRRRPASAHETALPRHSPHEERPESLEMERRLLRLAHPLDDDRERVQLGPEQADDEVVVVAIEAVAGEPDVEAEPGAAERHPDAAVLHEDRVLLAPRQLLERAGAAQRVPDRPRKRRIEDAPARALDERLLEVLLVADRVRAAEHRELGLRLELGERRGLEERPVLGDERLGRLAERQERDAGRDR